MPVELIIATIGAVGALAAAVVKTVLQRSEISEEVTVTVQRGQERIEKHGIMSQGEVSRVLDMVQDEPHMKVAAK